jgi:acetoin utilization deacetylase AcuC-like enzyme
MLDADTAASEDSYSAALRAAGGALVATETVIEGRHNSAFAFVRPPGHHAEADRAMGFCLFNNVAVAAEYARRVHGLRRIAIVDWDVHHGNGTMHAFYDTPEVLYVSLHQYPHFPGTGSARETGAGEGDGYTINIPFPGQQYDEDYLLAFDRVLLPVFRAYAPQLFLVSAGFDAHILDPLADMDLSSRCFGLMTRALQEVAREHSAPLAMVLEGGYAIKALAEGVASVLEALVRNGDGDNTEDWRPRDHHPSQNVTHVLERVRSALAPRWPCLRQEPS